MPQPLSKKAEKTILSSIQEVVSHVNAGLNPTDAVVKVAQDRKLGRDFINLVCTGYNTGATNFQRENESGVLNKFADFPLANAVEVAQTLWPSVVKKQTEKDADSLVSADYSRAPLRVRYPSVLSKAAAAAMVKQAEAAVKPIPTATFRTKVDDAIQKRSALRSHTEQLRKNAVDAKENSIRSLARFAEHVKYANELERRQIAFALRKVHGDIGKSLMKYAAVRNRFKVLEEDPPLFPVDWTRGGLKLAVECLELARRASEARIAYSTGKEANDARIDLIMSPFATAPEIFGEKQSSGMLSGVLLKSLVDGAKGSASSISDKATSMAESLADPEHENELRRIQAQTMLSNLLQNDDVISSYNPDEVLQAYNEVVQLSPRSATQPALIGPYLRKRLTQGSVEPFEAAEMVNVEKTLNQARQSPGHSKVSNVLDTTKLVV